MSMWEVPTRRILREEIGDTTSPYTYDHSRLDEVNLVAASYVANTMSFNYVYIVDLTTSTITPDPAEQSDYDFLILTALRAACIILHSEYRTSSAQGFSFKDGASSLDTRASLDAKKVLWEQAVKKFDAAKMAYQAGDRSNGHAIVGPYGTGYYTEYHQYR